MKTEKPDMKKYLNYLITVLSAVLCLFKRNAVYRGTLSIMRQKVVHIGLILLLAVLENVNEGMMTSRDSATALTMKFGPLPM